MTPTLVIVTWLFELLEFGIWFFELKLAFMALIVGMFTGDKRNPLIRVASVVTFTLFIVNSFLLEFTFPNSTIVVFEAIIFSCSNAANIIIIFVTFVKEFKLGEKNTKESKTQE